MAEYLATCSFHSSFVKHFFPYVKSFPPFLPWPLQDPLFVVSLLRVDIVISICYHTQIYLNPADICLYCPFACNLMTKLHMLASRKMMYHQNVSCNEPGHRAGRVRKARSTLIVINSNTMERLPFTRNGSGQQSNKLRDPKKGRTHKPKPSEKHKKNKTGKKGAQEKTHRSRSSRKGN
ncbi:hypothetical protein R103_M21056 [Saccharomyces cerevisiae R103]|nr:hypothetical protein R103_M21056 [Saccharomyces cerevisiae R103]